MKYCHSENICHLDLKDANILLDDKYNPIINDFGLSQNIYDQDGQINKITGKIGTPYIRCPEMFEEQVYYNGIDADIFSLGVLLFKLVFGIRGFLNAEHHSYNDIKNKNYEHYWERFKKSIEVRQLKLSPEFKNLYLRMVAYESSERPRIDEILNDPWLGEINNWLVCIMEANMYECNENEFILSFEKIKGDLEVFYDNILKIKKINYKKKL